MSKRLTKEAQIERDDFTGLYGEGNCSCHLSPPCNSCTHPGNPRNQEEDEACWEEEPPIFSARVLVTGKDPQEVFSNLSTLICAACEHKQREGGLWPILVSMKEGSIAAVEGEVVPLKMKPFLPA
ncbi:MAG TPA: hypothetical protein VEH04_16875 [Verrucomicrobiae bacterium]|nr:hypothetical protein [Verrucomicrobiae bacterium]